MNTSYKSLLLISLPAIVSVAMEPVAAMVDTALVGQLNSSWLAAMAISATILTTAAWVFNFLVYTVTARVAQAVGGGNPAEIGTQIKLALFTAAGLGVAVALVMMPLGPYLITHVMGASPEITQLALPYFDIRVLGMPFILVATSLIGILRGLQLIRTSLYQIAIVTIVNVLLTYLLLYVFDYGVAGAAIGTVASFAIGTGFGLTCLWRRRTDIGLTGASGSLAHAWKHALSFGSDALHLFIRTGFLTGSFFLATSIATRMGPDTVAAHAITMQLWIFAAFLLDGFAVTATSFGGKLLGEHQQSAKNSDDLSGKLARIKQPLTQWQQMNERLLILGIAVGIIFSLIYWAGQDLILGLFTQDPALLAIIAGYYGIVIIVQPLNGLVFVYDGILFGSRDFKFLKWSMGASVLVGALPAFYLADLRQTPRYIFWGFLFTNVVRSLSAYYVLRYKYQPEPKERVLAT